VFVVLRARQSPNAVSLRTHVDQRNLRSQPTGMRGWTAGEISVLDHCKTLNWSSHVIWTMDHSFLISRATISSLLLIDVKRVLILKKARLIVSRQTRIRIVDILQTKLRCWSGCPLHSTLAMVPTTADDPVSVEMSAYSHHRDSQEEKVKFRPVTAAWGLPRNYQQNSRPAHL
jgi:hypothetical protein